MSQSDDVLSGRSCISTSCRRFLEYGKQSGAKGRISRKVEVFRRKTRFVGNPPNWHGLRTSEDCNTANSSFFPGILAFGRGEMGGLRWAAGSICGPPPLPIAAFSLFRAFVSVYKRRGERVRGPRSPGQIEADKRASGPKFYSRILDSLIASRCDCSHARFLAMS